MKMTNRTRRMTKTRRTKQMRTIITQRLLFSGHTVREAVLLLLLPLLLRMRYSRTG